MISVKMILISSNQKTNWNTKMYQSEPILTNVERKWGKKLKKGLKTKGAWKEETKHPLLMEDCCKYGMLTTEWHGVVEQRLRESRRSVI